MPPQEVRRARNSALDGLRGIAILLVVAGHAGSAMWPHIAAGEEGPYGVPVLRGLLGGGAVVVFFVVGGFIVADGLLRERDRGSMDSARFLLRRVVRLGVQLCLLSAALVAVQALDPTAPGSMKGLTQNLSYLLSYTLNLLPLDFSVPARADVGHLWYLSVQQQCYLVLPLFLLTFARRRVLGCLVLAVLIGLVYIHRIEINDEFGWLLATVLTTTRSDGLMWGVLLALSLPLLRRGRRWSWVLAIAGAGTLACQLVIQELPPLSYLGPWSLVYQFFIGLMVVAIWLQTSPSLLSRALAATPLTWLGRNSLSIYFWHLPLFFVVARHVGDQPWWVAAGISFVILGVLVVVLERAVEEPTRRLLATHPLFRRSSSHEGSRT
jgi:peptidoglycan/LPS O-acetylase OafA/YrhL